MLIRAYRLPAPSPSARIDSQRVFRHPPVKLTCQQNATPIKP
ncbi:Alpha/beta hydrolase [Caenorhabditis elegans]|uniref:Alpha/beta hydrolase n=1 Tax=Caenorhabditis elegans TaxID=6239 RepID=D3DEM3_CAEEL|nr:Alpha/beta hydrolase [Caenorhabditis elegans]CBJ25115.1 Alpha/beta hydrolase [Caenorhabditis elegans]|eukprot:NP_001255862.1 Uncharacterized protein CELE_Y73F8A.1159 [Caenorhabditis elegans]